MYTLAQDAGDSTNAHHMLAALIDSELARGHTESAVRHGVELERRLAGGRHQSALAYARVNLTAALVAAGALGEARAMAQAAWPIALRFGIQHFLANHLASLALADGRAHDAALLSGYCDAGYAARGEKRVGTEAASTGATQSRLRQLLADSELERLRAAGAALADAQAFALAFGPLHPDPGGRSTTAGGSPPAPPGAGPAHDA
jgi:hypothetical protein